MARATVVIGLAGSGKTTFAKTLPGILFDEGVGILPAPTARFFDALRAGRDCVVVEATYCFAEARAQFVALLDANVPGTEIEWVCFRNDLPAANANCRRRPDKDPEGHVAINNRVAGMYTYPEGARIVDVFTPPPGGPS